MARSLLLQSALAVVGSIASSGCLTESRVRDLARSESRAAVDAYRGGEAMPALRALEESLARETDRRAQDERRHAELLAAVDRSIAAARRDLALARTELQAIRGDLVAVAERVRDQVTHVESLDERTASTATQVSRLERTVTAEIETDLASLEAALRSLEARTAVRRAPSTSGSPPVAVVGEIRVDTAASVEEP